MLLITDRSGGDSIPEEEITKTPMESDELIPLGARAIMTATNRLYGSSI